MKQSQYIS